MANDRGWNWHIWEVNPETKKPQKYVGFMNDEHAALEWVKKNGKDFYKVLNFGPLVHAQGSQVHRTVKKVKKPSGKAAAAMAAARAEADRRERERIKAKKALDAKTAKQRAEDAERMKEVRADAADLLKKHKADEAADLKAGINR